MECNTLQENYPPYDTKCALDRFLPT